MQVGVKEAVAAGIHLCDPAFAGSDTLATARALAAAIRSAGPFDLLLAGLNSADVDTGQVTEAVARELGRGYAGQPATRPS
jgi:electron transfer flavoprotein alpha/beta subunit